MIGIGDSPIGRTFWIQGGAQGRWQNLHSFTDHEQAVSMLGRLMELDYYDELRLIETVEDRDGGRPTHTELLCIRDGRILDQQRLEPPVVPAVEALLRLPSSSSKRDDGVPSYLPSSDNMVPELLPARDPLATPLALIRQDDGGVRNDRHTEAAAPARPRGQGLVFAAMLVGSIAIGVALAAYDPRNAADLFVTVASRLTGWSGESGLVAASVDGTVAKLQHILQAGADPNTTNRHGTPVLLLAARHHALDKVEALLHAGADPAAPSGGGRAVLHAAAAEGLTGAVRKMLDAGAPVDLAGGAHGCDTPLGLAAAGGREQTVRLLLDHGAALALPEGCPGSLSDLAAGHPAVLARLERAYADRIAKAKRLAEAEKADSRRPPSITKAQREALTHAQDPMAFGELLFHGIDTGDPEAVRFLLANRPPEIRLDELTKFVSDRWGTGYRSAADYAFLTGRRDVAAAVMAAGVVPSTGLLHLAIDNPEDPVLAGLASFLVEHGADTNAMHDGMTALMRAAHRGNRELVQLMIRHGADPSIQTKEGRIAADFAANSGDPALREALLVRADSRQYADLMFGLTWLDTLEEVRQKAGPCRDIGTRFVACEIDVKSWLPDAAKVEAHFDREAGDRLIALQIVSKPLVDESRQLDGATPRERFEEVRASIAARLPDDQLGFATRQAPVGLPFWEGLKPEVGAGAYYAYWSDDDKRKPAFVYLKLTGKDRNEGFYRIVIGNPFRIG